MASRRAIKNRRRKSARRLPWRRILLISLLVSAAVLAALIWPFWQLSGQFGTEPMLQPSRLYGQPREIRVGAPLGVEALAAELDSLGYGDAEATGRLIPGSYRRSDGRLELFRRRFLTTRSDERQDRLRITFRDGEVSLIETAEASLPSVSLDPPLIASFYGPDLRERRPIGLDELPEELILCVLAAEDAYFLEHSGLSFMGILRAAWVNFRAKEVRQGGSTLTQQLVKNLYLTHQRTLVRKLREGVLAIFLELRYDKRSILQAYLNEIYWGRSGSIDLMGVGAAAHAYFGKHASQLDLAESALLAGMIQSPGTLSPFTHLDAALARRDFVLGRLAQLKWVADERLERASRQKLRLVTEPLVTRRAPFFAAAAAAEARQRFGITELDDAGYTLLSTLSEEDQKWAEEAVTWGVASLEKGWEKDRQNSLPLEASLISVDPRTGGILAYVGGRNFGRSQFDRVASARRQAGSVFKPVVYAAAFADRVAHPATFLEDRPLSVRIDGRTWRPKNSDSKFRGRVLARTALEKSLNVPTARLAMSVGLDRVIGLARDLGIEGPIAPYPALALGAMGVSPLEMAGVYATFAAGGMKPTLHRLAQVYDRSMKAMPGIPLEPPRPVLAAETAHLITRILQGVLDRGTGRSARQQGIDDPLAGKTGTTNSRRDSWFAGYSPDRITLVWVGYDDNTSTRLSGARAALPIWSRFTHRVRPAGGYLPFATPQGVKSALIDPKTGALATDRCPQYREETFLASNVPRQLCPIHNGWRARPMDQPNDVQVEPQKHPFKRWLKMLKERRKRDRERGTT
ncbi:MAG: transglycosylase domain-containing protein [Acidobacteriota bacterium]